MVATTEGIAELGRKLSGGGRGIGRPTSPAAERLSAALRHGSEPLLDRRRRVALLSLGAMGSLSVVALYQLGIIRTVPEPPLPLLDADRVDASGEAYHTLRTPDAALGVASYATTLVLAAAGGVRRDQEKPWLSLLFTVKVALDAAGAALLTLEQASRHRRFCSWCLTAAALTWAMVPQVIPETRSALRRIIPRRG